MALSFPSEEPLARVKLTALAQQRLSKRGVGLNDEDLEGRGGVVLKAPCKRFDLAITSFISGYGSGGIRCDDQVGERRVPQHVRYGES